jgi:hypothetical protein
VPKAVVRLAIGHFTAHQLFRFPTLAICRNLSAIVGVNRYFRRRSSRETEKRRGWRRDQIFVDVGLNPDSVKS